MHYSIIKRMIIKNDTDIMENMKFSSKLSHAVLTVDKMADADQLTIADLISSGHAGAQLMEEAGLAVVREITKNFEGRRAVILCGPGNNGGDGFVVARHLKEAGLKVKVALLGSVNNLKDDALHMQNLWGDQIEALNPDALKDQDIIVDAIFGTGLSKEITGIVYDTLRKANDLAAHKIAVDIPSGIKGDTGEILGIAFKADQTVTFCRKKPAHLLYPGKQYCGEIMVSDIGINARTIEQVSPDIFENDPDLWINDFPVHAPTIHKYQRGHAVIVSGGMTHTGASRLAATAALRIGAGLVSISSPEDALAVHAAHLTAVMIRKRDQIIEDLKDPRLNAWCIGPAAGLGIKTRKNVLQILRAEKKTVLDADALTVFEQGPLELFDAINLIEKNNCVLTPHSGEFARLFPNLKQLDKISAAGAAAKLSGAVVIYKGADSVIAAPDGRTVISNNAPATLATAGSGDVLAGLVCGLMAQNMPPFEASCAAVWIQAQCANEIGVGLISEDLPSCIPLIMKQLFEKY